MTILQYSGGGGAAAAAGGGVTSRTTTLTNHKWVRPSSVAAATITAAELQHPPSASSTSSSVSHNPVLKGGPRNAMMTVRPFSSRFHPQYQRRPLQQPHRYNNSQPSQPHFSQWSRAQNETTPPPSSGALVRKGTYKLERPSHKTITETATSAAITSSNISAGEGVIQEGGETVGSTSMGMMVRKGLHKLERSDRQHASHPSASSAGTSPNNLDQQQRSPLAPAASSSSSSSVVEPAVSATTDTSTSSPLPLQPASPPAPPLKQQPDVVAPAVDATSSASVGSTTPPQPPALEQQQHQQQLQKVAPNKLVASKHPPLTKVSATAVNALASAIVGASIATPKPAALEQQKQQQHQKVAPNKLVSTKSHHRTPASNVNGGLPSSAVDESTATLAHEQQHHRVASNKLVSLKHHTPRPPASSVASPQGASRQSRSKRGLPPSKTGDSAVKRIKLQEDSNNGQDNSIKNKGKTYTDFSYNCSKANKLVRVAVDEAKTRICPTFCRGLPCLDVKCRLRHDVTLESTRPFCRFFQKQGMCLRENCPFRHVKVNPLDTPCPLFTLLGFCNDPECTLMHKTSTTKNQQQQTPQQQQQQRNHYPHKNLVLHKKAPDGL